MNEMKINGKTFKYEKVKPEQFKSGACVFRIVDDDGDENWWVVVPTTLEAQLKGVEINCPDDGHVTAFCMCEQDALMLASSVCLAASIATFGKEVVDKAKSEVVRKTKELADKLDFDLDALEAEVKKLKAEGKSPKEISEILKPRMEEFRKKPSTDKGGEW